jgi:hypothetical protein
MAMMACGIIAITLMALRGLMNKIKRRLHLGQLDLDYVGDLSGLAVQRPVEGRQERPNELSLNSEY